MKERKFVLFVVGVHRSGTSAIAGACNIMGLDPGQTLMAANAANAKGFWENQLIVNEHDRLLSDLGLDWDTADTLPIDWCENALANRAAANLKTILEEDFDPHKNWVIKDPRLCFMLPLWTNLIKELGRTALVLLVFRHPQEVVASLVRRDGISSARAISTFLHCTLNSIECSTSWHRDAITYETALRFGGEFGRVLSSMFPQLELDQGSKRIAEYLARDLRHENAQADGSQLDELFRNLQNSSDGPLPISAVLRYIDGVKSIYAHLANGPEDTEQDRELEAIRARAVLYKRHYLRLESELRTLHRTVAAAANKKRGEDVFSTPPQQLDQGYQHWAITADECKVVVRASGIRRLADGRCVGCGFNRGWQFVTIKGETFVTFNRSCSCTGQYSTGDPRTWEEFAAALNSRSPQIRAEMLARLKSGDCS